MAYVISEMLDNLNPVVGTHTHIAWLTVCSTMAYVISEMLDNLNPVVGTHTHTHTPLG
jgi:hypothetical protein